jgi:hypothetical protein
VECPAEAICLTEATNPAALANSLRKKIRNVQASKQRLFEATAGCKFELFSLHISIFSNNLRSGKARFFCNF